MVAEGYKDYRCPPGYGIGGVTDYIANHNILRAHGKAYQVYNNTYKATQNGEDTFILPGTKICKTCTRQLRTHNCEDISILPNTDSTASPRWLLRTTRIFIYYVPGTERTATTTVLHTFCYVVYMKLKTKVVVLLVIL